jgi:hypothetical protein
MTVWVLIVVLGTGVAEADVFYTQARCEAFAQVFKARQWEARCEPVTVKQ